MSRRHGDPLETLRSVVRAALLSLVVLLPLAFGGVQPLAVVVFEVAAFLIGAAALLILSRDPEGLPPAARALLVPASVVPLVATLQLVPFPQEWTRLVAYPTWQARQELAALLPELAAGMRPQSLDPAATLDASLRFLACASVALAAAVSVRTRRHLIQALAAVALSGAFQGFYGAAEFLTGRQHVFGYPKQYFLDSATGTFINRNHYAGYLAATLPAALVLLFEGLRDLPRDGSWRRRVVGFSERSGLPLIAGALAAGMIWSGVMLSYSRAGMLVAVAGLLCLARGTRLLAGRGRALAVALVVPSLLLVVQGIRVPGERFADGAGLASVGGRLPAWKATLHMVPDYLPFGSGLGTYAAVFDGYRPADVATTWDHAHNDWLQALAEGGPLVLLSMLLVLALILRQTILANRTSASVPAWGVTAGIVVLVLHALVDFGLRIPAVALLAALLVGLSCAAVESLPSPVPVPIRRNRGSREARCRR